MYFFLLYIICVEFRYLWDGKKRRRNILHYSRFLLSFSFSFRICSMRKIVTDKSIINTTNRGKRILLNKSNGTKKVDWDEVRKINIILLVFIPSEYANETCVSHLFISSWHYTCTRIRLQLNAKPTEIQSRYILRIDTLLWFFIF